MNDTARIATNLRLLLIVEVLARAGRPRTPSELNAELRLPKQTVHRLCRTLVDEGFLVRSTGRTRLQPSARLRAVATGLLTASDVDIGRHQVLLHIAGGAQYLERRYSSREGSTEVGGASGIFRGGHEMGAAAGRSSTGQSCEAARLVAWSTVSGPVERKQWRIDGMYSTTPA